MHDGHRWLGSCREFARVLPRKRPAPPLVLRGLAPGDQLRVALAPDGEPYDLFGVVLDLLAEGGMHVTLA